MTCKTLSSRRLLCPHPRRYHRGQVQGIRPYPATSAHTPFGGGPPTPSGSRVSPSPLRSSARRCSAGARHWCVFSGGSPEGLSHWNRWCADAMGSHLRAEARGVGRRRLLLTSESCRPSNFAGSWSAVPNRRGGSWPLPLGGYVLTTRTVHHSTTPCKSFEGSDQTIL